MLFGCKLASPRFPPTPADECMGRLTELAALLTPYLSSVTQLKVILKGDVPVWFDGVDVSPAADVLRTVGPLCGPLTHLSTSGKVTEDNYQICYVSTNVYYDDFCKAASEVCPLTLTHLTFDLLSSEDAKLTPKVTELEHPDDANHLGYITVGYVARAALASLRVLKHLDLGSGSVHCAATWRQLPPSLTSLKLGEPSYLPRRHVIQFRLGKLDIVCCNCKVLRLLLQASPDDLQLSVRSLVAPMNMAEELDLAFIVQHPAWLLANSGAPNCPPVKELYMEDYFPLRPHQHGYLSSRKMLSSLPIMPSITDFSLSCEEAQGQGNLPVLQNPVRLLEHIPFALPNLSYLNLDSVPSLDSDLTGLHACTSLRVMKLGFSKFVSGHALMTLAAALPNLVTLDVSHCEHVSDEDQQALAAFLESRA